MVTAGTSFGLMTVCQLEQEPDRFHPQDDVWRSIVHNEGKEMEEEIICNRHRDLADAIGRTVTAND